MTNQQKVSPAEEELIREAQRQYHAEYYKKNRKKILERNKQWQKENAEKRREINRNYWLRKAKQTKA